MSVAVLTAIGVGIDTARYGHRVSFMRPDRQPAAQPLTVLENHEGYQRLRQCLERLQEQHPQAQFHVRIDAAGQYAVNLERFLRGLAVPMILSVGEPKRNKDYQKAHFPKRTSDDTESQAMARFAVVEQPAATPAPPQALALLRDLAGRLQAQVKQTTQTVNRLHNLLARVFPELGALTTNLAAAWVLQLLDKYPTAPRLAQARLSSLYKIPFLPADKAQALHQAAQHSVASLHGELAETLVRELVTQVRQAQAGEQRLHALLLSAYADLPPSGHVHLESIPGIGAATAAVLVAKIVAIERFETPDQLVGYFGLFPEENSSGVDAHGQPWPAGTLHMSRKGNDLVRAYLWNAAFAALQHNPAVRALYRRLRGKGRRGDIATGHCMRKLLHLVYAVWKTNRPFDAHHYPWQQSSDSPPSTPPAAVVPAAQALAGNDKAVGHKGELAPTKQVVTTAPSNVNAAAPPVNVPAAAAPAAVTVPAAAAAPAAVTVPAVATAPSAVTVPAVATAPLAGQRPRPRLDFTFLRQQITIAQVLQHLGLFEDLKGRTPQLRGCCPLHDGDRRRRTLSVHLAKNVFHCFHSGCQAQGNTLDFWAAYHRLPLYEAAVHLAETFHLPRNREEAPVMHRTNPRPPTATPSAVITADGT